MSLAAAPASALRRAFSSLSRRAPLATPLRAASSSAADTPGKGEGEGTQQGSAGPRDDAGRPEPVYKQPEGEYDGPKGPEPTRYGDWERKGRCSDF